MMLLLAGCAGFGQTRVFSTEAELLDRRGTPDRVWANNDGTRTLEYSRQPMGIRNWMYTVDANGGVVAQFDALTRENLRRVRAGMTTEEVERLLGRHREVNRFRLSGEEVWNWNVENEGAGLQATLFNVHFVDGVVKHTSFTLISPGNGESDRGE
ncbi:hypothetical protein ACKVEX_00030 [Rhodocyclaceae bacterium SMB388]